MQRMFWKKKSMNIRKRGEREREAREKKEFDLPNTKIHYKVKIVKT